MILRNQFASELQQQGNILRDLVDDMKSYRDLYDAAEKYGGTIANNFLENLSTLDRRGSYTDERHSFTRRYA